RQADPPEARAFREDRGAAARRRIYPRRRQRAGDPVRARHPHLRDGDAQHARSQRRALYEAAHPPAGRRRSLARHRHSRSRRPNGAGGRGLRRGWPAHRGPREPAGGALRRRPVALPGPVRRADADLVRGARRDRAGAGMSRVRAFTRTLPRAAGAFDLYRSLCAGRADTLLIEKADGPALLMERAALRLECRGLRVSATALSANGRAALEAIAARLGARVAARAEGRLDLQFPPVTGDDAGQRLRAPAPLDAVRALLALDNRSPEEPLALFLPFVIAFDYAANLEGLPAGGADPTGFPDYVAWLAESLIVVEPRAALRIVCAAFGDDETAAFAAQERLSALVARAAAAPPAPPGAIHPQPGPVAVDLDDEEYGALVERMRGHLAAGEVYQIVPSRTFSAPCPDPLAAFAALRGREPSPYRYHVAGGDFVLLGASPETSVRVFREN